MGFFDGMWTNIVQGNFRGWYGEALTERELMLVKLFGRDGKVLRNVYIPKDNGETSELDVIFITQKGIFVFESKNYSGWIFGDEKAQYWTASLPNGQKNRFYNPIKQNRTHIKWLGKYLGDDIPLFSIIAFSERCELKKITVESPDVKVIKRDYTYAAVRSIWKTHPDVLEADEIEELYEQLKELTNVDAATKAAHVANIEKKYKRTERRSEKKIKEKDLAVPAVAEPMKEEPEEEKIAVAMSTAIFGGVFDPEKETVDWGVVKDEPEHATPGVDDVSEPEVMQETEAAPEPEAESELEPEPAVDSAPICPRCGGKLILRTARKGANAGNQFWGCESFPRCRYIKS